MAPAAQVAILAFFAILFAVRALTARVEGKSEEVVNRVRRFSSPAAEKENNESQYVKISLLTAFGSILKVFTPKKLLSRMEADLIQADVLLKPEEILFIMLAAATVPAAFVALVLKNVGAAVLLVPIGAAVPHVYIKSAKARRVKKFNDQLGDALTIMANSLRAGFSFLQTMDSLSKELAPPISVEFGRALKEMRLGTQTEDALHNMTERIESEDLGLIVTAVNIQRQVGGNLAQILDNIASTINERVRMKGEIKTLTAQGKISGTIVALLPVLLLLVIALLNPAYIGLLFTHPIGMVMLGVAIVSEVIGILMIRKVIHVEM